MKIIINIVISIWMLFLSLPTITYIVGDEKDISISYTLSEEETENQFKVFEENFKDIHLNAIQNFVLYVSSLNNKINNPSIVNKNSVYKDTYSPPPELI